MGGRLLLLVGGETRAGYPSRCELSVGHCAVADRAASLEILIPDIQRR